MSRSKPSKKPKVIVKPKAKSTFQTENSISSETVETAIIVTELYRHLIGHSQTFDYTSELKKYFYNQFMAMEKSTFFPIAEENLILQDVGIEEKLKVGISLNDLPPQLSRVTFILQLAETSIEMFSDIEQKRVVEYAIGFTVYDKKIMLRVAKRLMDGGWTCDFFSYGLPLNFIDQYLSESDIEVELISPFGDAKFPSDEYIITSLKRWVKLLTTMIYLMKISGNDIKTVRRPFSYDGKNFQIAIAESSVFENKKSEILAT